MKKLFRKALKTDKPFDVWTKEHGIIQSEKRQNSQTIFKKPIAVWSCIIAVLIIATAVVLPFILADNSPKIYSSQDTVTMFLSLDELYEKESLLLFDSKQILQYDRIGIDFPIENEFLSLSYNLVNCLIATNDGVNGFYVDYTIRLYPYYNFYSYEHYSDLTSKFVIGSTEVYYKIKEEVKKSDSLAYIKFIYNNLEYFLQVKGFDGVTELSENTLKILLGDLLKA